MLQSFPKHVLVAAVMAASLVVTNPICASATSRAQEPTPGDRQEISQTVQSYLLDLALTYTNPERKRATLPKRQMSAQIMDRHYVDIDKIRSNATEQIKAGHRLSYSGATVTVWIEGLSTTKAGTTAQIKERIEYILSQPDPQAPSAETEYSSREFLLAKDDGTWQIIGEPPPPVVSMPARIDQLRRTTISARDIADFYSKDRMADDDGARGSEESLAPKSVSSFDDSAAASYARLWYSRNNPAYVSFSQDCTNFTSQALREGGWPEKGFTFPWQRTDDRYWEYSSNSLYRSYSWAGAHNFFTYARVYSGRVTVKGKMSSLWLGDIVQID